MKNRYKIIPTALALATCVLLGAKTLFAATFLLLNQGVQQDTQKQKTPDKPAEPIQINSFEEPLAFILRDGTPIELRLTRNLSSADATKGDRVEFEVREDVKVKDTIVVRLGGIAIATVKDVVHKHGKMGGELNLNIDDVCLIDGERVPLRARRSPRGDGHIAMMPGPTVARAIVFFPGMPPIVTIRGKDITIPKGTEITAYIRRCRTCSNPPRETSCPPSS